MQEAGMSWRPLLACSWFILGFVFADCSSAVSAGVSAKVLASLCSH